MIILMIYLIDNTKGGSTALHRAVIYGRYNCTQLLIQAGTVVDIKNTVSTLYVHTIYQHSYTHDISY